jgi:DNA processing protein
MDVDERTFLLILSSIVLTVNRFPSQSVFKNFTNAEALFRASEKELLDVEGMPVSAAKKIVAYQTDESVKRGLQELDRQGIQMVPYYAKQYPENLKTIKDAPPVLYVRGALERGDSQALAVVGSRKATAYGIEVCQALTSALVSAGFCIISGMATGIDAMAHWSAIEQRGRTLGVLGTGLDIIYPKSNVTLYQKISEQGALVSEFSMGTKPYPENFPRRNRIISGLSLGVMVVEASERSGTMTTVRMALEQGREVFAVPGDIRSEKSRGTHKLIKQGAKLVDRIDDILEELNLTALHLGKDRHIANAERENSDILSMNSSKGVSKGHTTCIDLQGQILSEEANQVLQAIGLEGTLLDRIIARCGLSPAKVASLLTELEILGKVRPLAGNRFQRLS